MRHPLRSAIDLFRSRWWSIGWGVAAVAFALHVAALTLAPISIGQAVLAGGLVFLAVLAERFFGFELGRRQWIGIGLVAVSLSLLTLTGGGGGGGAHSGYSLAGMIIFESIAVCVGLLLVLPDSWCQNVKRPRNGRRTESHRFHTSRVTAARAPWPLLRHRPPSIPPARSHGREPLDSPREASSCRAETQAYHSGWVPRVPESPGLSRSGRDAPFVPPSSERFR
jgi:hypothetical protein